MENSEDAGVYRLRDDLAIVLTVDFFTPIVDDPREFGRIAAANSLSDVYAMGARPVTALNIVGYPLKTLGPEILGEILAGGLDKIHEAGASLVGGHSVEDGELKYGLSVTGTVHPDLMIRNSGAEVGDLLVLSKPLGTGAIATALKQGKAEDAWVAGMIACMSSLNRAASEAMLEAGVSAATDITGFGLIGHASEMARGRGVALTFDASCAPALPGAIEALELGAVCGGTKRNRNHYTTAAEGVTVEIDDGIAESRVNLLFDAQTSGGLLLSVRPDRLEELVAGMQERGIEDAAIVGQVTDGPAGNIRIQAGST